MNIPFLGDIYGYPNVLLYLLVQCTLSANTVGTMFVDVANVKKDVCTMLYMYSCAIGVVQTFMYFVCPVDTFCYSSVREEYLHLHSC